MNTDELREIWTMFQRDHKCSIDRMLCDPGLRSRFLEATRAIFPDDETTILWALVSLRKNKRLPSRLR